MLRTKAFSLLALAMTCAAAGAAQPAEQSVRIGVLSLFHPTELRLRAGDGCRLQLVVGGVSRTLPGGDDATITAVAPGDARIRVRLRSGQYRAETLSGRQLTAACADPVADRDAGLLWLEVPAKLRRTYAGSVEIHARARARVGVLEAVVTMPLETAVASVIEAESPPQAGLEALKAQAVAARSFLVAHSAAHRGFDFCDTTHCQFLRSPPAAGSAAARAVRATAGVLLTYRDESSAQDVTLPAMYSRSCGGQTRSLRGIGVRATSGYPYYAVHCAYCSRHPETWQGAAGTPHVRNERDRLAWNRIHGWGAIPSLSADGGTAGLPLTGRGSGHGVGLCQLGAADMARHGAGFAQILAHYYPNTRLTSIPAR